MAKLVIRDAAPTGGLSFDLRDVLSALGERATFSRWQITPLTASTGLNEVMVTGEAAADRLEEVSRSGERIPGALLQQLARDVVQVIWGEFRAYDGLERKPWVIVRAIDSSWFEVETEAVDALQSLR